MDQIRPLGTVTPVYRTDGGPYPDELLVPMDNGHVVRYLIKGEQTRNRHFVEAMDILQKLPLFGGRKYRMGQQNRDCDGSPG